MVRLPLGKYLAVTWYVLPVSRLSDTQMAVQERLTLDITVSPGPLFWPVMRQQATLPVLWLLGSVWESQRHPWPQDSL